MRNATNFRRTESLFLSCHFFWRSLFEGYFFRFLLEFLIQNGGAIQLTFDEPELTLSSSSAVTSFVEVFSRGTGTCIFFFLPFLFPNQLANFEFCLSPQNSPALFRVHITTLLCIWFPPLPLHFLSLPLFFVSWALRGGQKFPPSKK